jgi:hypothetical protein
MFFARTSRNVAQDRSILSVHEDPSNESDEVDCEKDPLCTDLFKIILTLSDIK